VQYVPHAQKTFGVKHATAVTQTVLTRATKTQDTAYAREDITTLTVVKANVLHVPKRATKVHAIPCPVFVSVSYISFSDSMYKTGSNCVYAISYPRCESGGLHNPDIICVVEKLFI